MDQTTEGNTEHDQTTATSSSPKKDFKSAIIIMPPDAYWEQIQSIRKEHDKGYVRWMPHINMTFPFIKDVIEELVFKDAAHNLSVALKDVSPFRVKFSKDSFSYFRHKKTCTLWLNPLPSDAGDQARPEGSTGGGAAAAAAAAGVAAGATLEPHPSVLQIQNILVQTFPMCDELCNKSENGFTPHLSVGQFPPKKVDDALRNFSGEWEEVEFDIKEIYLISRKNFLDPFHIRYAIPFGGKSPIELNRDYVVETPDVTC